MPTLLAHRQRRALLRSLAAAGLGVGIGMPCAAGATLAADHLQVSRPRVGALPAVALTTMNGQPRVLDQELASDAPLILNFVFTTCSSSCSVQTALLAEVQRGFSARGRSLRLASITIDPENDTPEQLRRFAGQFRTAEGWQFYTGRFDDLLRVQKHFAVYRGSKGSHPPVLLLRRHSHAPWVRVEGFPAPSEVAALIESLPTAA